MLINSNNRNWSLNSQNPILYNRIQGFSEGLAPVKFRKKWGFIDTEGNIIISSYLSKLPLFSWISPVTESSGMRYPKHHPEAIAFISVTFK